MPMAPAARQRASTTSPADRRPPHLTIDNSTIVSNTAATSGGGIWSHCTLCTSITTTITNSTIVGNDGGTPARNAGGLLAGAEQHDLGSELDRRLEHRLQPRNSLQLRCGEPRRRRQLARSQPRDCDRLWLHIDRRPPEHQPQLPHRRRQRHRWQHRRRSRSPPPVPLSTRSRPTPRAALAPTSATSPAAGIELRHRRLRARSSRSRANSSPRWSAESSNTHGVDRLGRRHSQSAGSVDPTTREVTGTHTYADAGIYHGTLHWTNSDGFPADVFVRRQGRRGRAKRRTAPRSMRSPARAFAGPVATFTDANPLAIVADFVATINWGDGTPASAGTVSPGSAACSSSAARTRTPRPAPTRPPSRLLTRATRSPPRRRRQQSSAPSVARDHRAAGRQGQHDGRVSRDR